MSKMAFLHTSSAESLKTELDLWAVPPTQTAVETGHWVTVNPLSTLDDANTIEFVVPGNGEEYIDPAHTLLYVQCKIVKGDGTNIAAADDVDVGPINYLLHSMWSQVDVSLNGKLVSQSASTYGYRSYIETALGYDHPAKTSHLTSRMWYKDTAGKMDVLADNKGLDSRKLITAGSKHFEMMGAMHGDIFNQDKYIINNVEMRITFQRAKDQFVLMSTHNEKLKILKMYLMVRKVLPSPAVRLGHAEAILLKPTSYPITRTDVKTVSITAGLQDKSIDNVYLGPTPKRITIGFVDNRAFNGSYAFNPFNFTHFQLNYLSLYIDSKQIPSKPLTPDFTNQEYIEAYHTLFSGTGIHFKDEGNDISRVDYPNGYCLFVFDLTSDMSANEGFWNLQRQGTVRLEVRFKEALAAPINCVILSEFNNLIEIDRHRNVVVDFSN